MEDLPQKSKKKRHLVSWFIRRQVVLEYLEGSKTLQQLSEAYRIPHQSISRWVRSYGDDLKKRKERILIDMTEEQKQYEALRQQNDALKKELEFAQMKSRAMEIILDLAKEEYGIDLRRNSGAKQPENSKKTTRRQR